MLELSPTANEFFADNPVAEELDKIVSFQYSINYTKVPLLQEKQVLAPIAGMIVTALAKKLDALEIYAADNLKVQFSEEGGISINFADDIYHFGLRMNDSSFVFIRAGGKLTAFFSVIDALMDDISGIFNEVSAYLEGLRAQGGPSFLFSPHYCGYSFIFNLRDFTPSSKSTRSNIPNYELMERIVPSIQMATSPLSAVGFATRGRTDVSISGTLQVGDVNWYAWVGIEAPGNQNYSIMNLTVQLQSTVHDFSGKRRPFDPNSIGKWRTVISGFLKAKIFNGFLKDWLGDVNFKADSQGI
jgi:hypothetical protein